MPKIYVIAPSGGNHADQNGQSYNLPDQLPTASHLEPASRWAGEERINQRTADLTCVDFGKLVVGDKVVLGQGMLPTWASLQSMAIMVQGAPGMTFALSWEKGFAPGAATAVQKMSYVDPDCKCEVVAAIPTALEAKGKDLYIARYDTTKPANFTCKADRLVLEVKTLPTKPSDAKNLEIMTRVNYLTHANVHSFRVCPCKVCEETGCGA